MNLDDLYDAFDEFAGQARRCIQASMEKNGGNDKLHGYNTLIDSHIYEEIEVDVVSQELINVMVHDYIEYIESGMQPGHWVNEEYLLPWMVDKNIPTDNNTLYNIQYSIWKWGITPRPIMDDAWKMLDEYFEDFADKVIEILMTDVEEFFD